MEPEERARYMAGAETIRLFASFIDDEPVAKVATWPMTMNVRGKVMAMGGISGVASMPAARRGGHVRALLNHAISDMRDNGEFVSGLYPFKTAYYEKFGYAGWQAPVWVQFEPSFLAPYLRAEATGEIRQRLSKAGTEDYARVLTAAQKSTHGMSLFNRTKQDASLSFDRSWIVTVHKGDEVTAGLEFKTDIDKSEMVVFGVFWNTFNGKVQVLDFLARHADHMERIRMPLLPGEEPHLWATAQENLAIVTNDGESWGAPMARVVDVIGLAGIGAGDGAVTLTVSDEQAPWNNGTFTFTGNNGSLLVHEGGESAGHVTIQGFSALVFSGIDPQLLPIRGWGSVSAEAAATLRTLFPPVVPFIHTKF